MYEELCELHEEEQFVLSVMSIIGYREKVWDINSR